MNEYSPKNMTIPASIVLRHSSSGSFLRSIEFTPRPHSLPDNVSGRPCLVTCNAFSVDFTVAPTDNSSTNTYILTSSWTSPCSRIYSDSSTVEGRAVLGCMMNAQSYNCGPVLINMPEGPQDVTFTVSRTDGGDLCGSNSTNVVFVSLTITPVDC